jgi:hypothetical protein
VADIQVGYSAGDLYAYVHIAISPDAFNFDDNKILTEIDRQLDEVRVVAKAAMAERYNKDKDAAKLGKSHAPSP